MLEGSGRQDGSGANAVDADVVRAEVHGHVARHLRDGGLRGAIGKKIRLGNKA